jgi:hypothetical protein
LLNQFLLKDKTMSRYLTYSLILVLLVLGTSLQAQTFRDIYGKGPAGVPVLPAEEAAQILQGNWQVTSIDGAPDAVQEQLRQNQARLHFNAEGTLRMEDKHGSTEQQWQWIEGGRMMQAYSRENPWGTGHIEILGYQNGQMILRITDIEHQQHVLRLQRDEQTPENAMEPAERKTGLW